MKAKHVKLINLIVAVLVALFCIGQAFAWFATGKMSRNSAFNGRSAGAYFAYGTGTEKDPFGINTRYHLYNLAWLQNTGRLVDANGTSTQYYFELDPELSEEIDMSNFWLPPIGNDENPFIGVFNGNGKKISNLKITTNKSKLTANPAGADYKFSNAVGFFGMTGSESEIRNFILDDPLVEAAAPANTLYSNSANLAIGLAIGHVAGKASSIGVYTNNESTAETILNIERAGYSTFNSIIGELADNVTTSVTGGGGGSTGSGGSGSSFGANFDVNGFLDRLLNIYKGKYGQEWSGQGASLDNPMENLLPIISNQNIYPAPGDREKIPFTVTNESNYDYAPYAREVIANNNIGYYIGNQNKLDTKEVRFTDEKLQLNKSTGEWTFSDGTYPVNNRTPKAFYTYTNLRTLGTSYNIANGFKEWNEAVDGALPQDIKDLLVDDEAKLVDPSKDKVNDGKIRYVVVKLVHMVWLQHQLDDDGIPLINYISHSHGNDSGWSHYGQINWMGKTYGEGFRANDGNAINEDGVYYTKDGYLLDGDYIYDENGYVAVDEDWDLPIWKIDSEGHAMLDEYNTYFKYRLDVDGEYTEGFIDQNGYFYDVESGSYIAITATWPSLVLASFKIHDYDNDGYALYSPGVYYDSSGGIMDSNGYVMGVNGDGYYADPQSFLWDAYIGEDGYIKQSNGENFTDNNGNPILGVGYYSVDSAGYLINSDGSRATYINQWGGTVEIKAKTGTKIQVVRGSDMGQYTNFHGTYINVKTGIKVDYNELETGIYLPDDSIWFKPSQSGKIRFVMYAESAKNNTFQLLRVERTAATNDNPFYTDTSLTPNDQGDIKAEILFAQNIVPYTLIYYEYDCTDDFRSGNIEYVLSAYNGGGADFIYMDLGASAADDYQDNFTYDSTVNVSAIDFIYKDVEISQSGTLLGNFIIGGNLYEATGTSVYFEELSTALQIIYVRLTGTYTMDVDCGGSAEVTDTRGKTIFR